MRPCERLESTITVTELKVGAGTTTLQLDLSQNGGKRILALATATNLDKVVGPTASTAWSFYPPTKPIPKFSRVSAKQPEENWLPFRLIGEILPFTARMLNLYPREGFPVDGVCDAWTCFTGEEYMDSTYLTAMADIIPSMSDTLLHNDGIYDARRIFAEIEQWANENPGIPMDVKNTLKQGMKARIFNNTLTLDIEFKRRVPKEGIQWTFVRSATRMMDRGRLDLDVTICNEKMELLCLARQVILVLDSKRKFGRKGLGALL
jgi:hypothetical protein